jgi:hydroxypyruvate isomerase
MDRRVFLQSAGVLAASLRAQSPPVKAGITPSVMLDTIDGPVERQLEAVAKAGIPSAELLNQWATWPDADIDRIAGLCRSNHVALDALMAQPDWKKRPVSLVDSAHRENFLKDVRRAIAVSQRLGISQLLMNSGLSAAGKTREEQYASMTEGIKRAADLVAAAKMTMIIEPLNSLVDHQGCYLTSSADGLKLVREINHPNVRLLFDVYHEQVMRGNLIRSITEAAPLVSIFHVADNPGRNDPGTGEINFPNVYKAIQKTGFSGYITMEYKPLGDPVASLSRAVAGLRAALA